MQIKPDERFSGIVFDNTQQAVLALAMYMRDFREHAQYTGPEKFAELLDHPEKLLQFDGFRLQGFLEDLGEYGYASRNYGSHIASVLSNLQLSIRPISMNVWDRETLLGIYKDMDEDRLNRMIETSRNDADEYSRNSVTTGTMLEITPNLVNSMKYEDAVVGILNSLTGKLASHFNNKQYRRILRSTSFSIDGSENEIIDAADMIVENPEIWGIDSGHTTEFQGEFKYVPEGDDGSLPAKIWRIDLYGNRFRKESHIWLKFSHPKNTEGVHYANFDILHGARDRFKASLEGRLGQITDNPTPQ